MLPIVQAGETVTLPFIARSYNISAWTSPVTSVANRFRPRNVRCVCFALERRGPVSGNDANAWSGISPEWMAVAGGSAPQPEMANAITASSGLPRQQRFHPGWRLCRARPTGGERVCGPRRRRSSAPPTTDRQTPSRPHRNCGSGSPWARSGAAPQTPLTRQRRSGWPYNIIVWCVQRVQRLLRPLRKPPAGLGERTRSTPVTPTTSSVLPASARIATRPASARRGIRFASRTTRRRRRPPFSSTSPTSSTWRNTTSRRSASAPSPSATQPSRRRRA